MFELSGMDNLLGPFEGMCILGIGGSKGINSPTEISGRSGIQPSQGLPPQYAEPAFHLVEPRGMGWCVMEMNMGMFSQPPVVLLAYWSSGYQE